jgi:hypothetical protein
MVWAKLLVTNNNWEREALRIVVDWRNGILTEKIIKVRVRK